MTYRPRLETCPACHGSGTIIDVARVSGEPIYADRIEVGCEACVDGMTDAACKNCLTVTALNDEGFCERCSDADELSLAEWKAKYGLVDVEHLGPGRIAA